MNVLSIYPLPGISYTHDASACIANDEGLLFACEEERLLRTQHAIAHFPERSAMLGFQQTNLQPEDIDQLVITSMDSCSSRHDYELRLKYAREMLNLSSSTPVACFSHHETHSALAVLSSPFDECIFITLDGGGDGFMGQWGVFRNGHFDIGETIGMSPAIFFSFVTSMVGFPLFEEGKTMGLAPYGVIDQRLLHWFHRNFRIKKDGAALVVPMLHLEWKTIVNLKRLDPDSFARQKYFQLGVCFIGEEDLRWIDEIPPADIARTGQLVFNELMHKVICNLVKRTGIHTVACGGGAFQNVISNGMLMDIPGIAVFIPVAPHDAGLALGASLLDRHRRGFRRLAFPLSPYQGPSFSREKVQETIQDFGFQINCPSNLNAVVAEALASSKVVGWFQGRSEFGARALGARSVLADPRSLSSKDRLNQLLKKRDWFMPYAPSILLERGSEFFEEFQPSPYMNVALRVRNEIAHRIPGALHIDGTCRAHTVDAKMNPQYYELISHFHALTGIPMILNTSFNRHGLPMVATPRQAMQHLAEGTVDALAIEGFFVEASKQREYKETPRDDHYYLSMMALRRAAVLARNGFLESADSLLARVHIPLGVMSEGFTYDEGLIWHTASSIEELEAWWHNKITKDSICG